jgi:hypothetical protein
VATRSARPKVQYPVAGGLAMLSAGILASFGCVVRVAGWLGLTVVVALLAVGIHETWPWVRAKARGSDQGDDAP